MLAARGDSLGASFDGPARAIRCAEAIVAESDDRESRAGPACTPASASCTTGELRGVAVDVAAEILARAAPGEVLVSRTVADLVAGARIGFVDRGSHALAAVGDSWQLLASVRRERAGAGRAGRAARCGSGARGTTGRSRSAGRWSACATPRASATWRGSSAIPTASSTCSTCWPATHRAEATRRARTVSPRRRRTPEPCWTSPPSTPTASGSPTLEAEIEQARRWNDPERTAHAEGELDALTRELAGALGLGGRDRRAASDSERARASVSKAVRGAVRRLEEQHPELGRHLSLAVRTGTFCSYDPDPRVPLDLGRLRSPP